MYEWTYNEDSADWFYGNNRNGIGVWYDTPGKWYANVVVNYHLTFLGPYDTLEEAKTKSLQFFHEKKETQNENQQT